MLVFFFCAGAILYVLAGYPLLLGWLSSRRSRPAVYRSEPKTVTVLLAVHNGSRFLEQKLDSIAALDYPQELINVVVISDGSTDETDAIAEGRKDRRVELIRVPRGGKAAALNAGIARATGELLLFTDVRQRLDPASLRILVDRFADPTVGVASGELILMESQTAEQRDVGLYRRYESWIRMRLARLDSIFGATGCLYAMRRELAVPMPADTLLDDVYLPISAFFRGYRLIFEERAKAFDFPTTLDMEFRRKVRTLAGNYQIMRSFPALLGLRNRLWIHFVSYKLGRLLLPWLLLGLALSSFWLPPPAVWLALGAQGLFYLAAALDLIIPPLSRLKKLSSPPRTFVVLVVAAACASVVFFVPAQTLWKETKVA